jgi:hypothetical protein
MDLQRAFCSEFRCYILPNNSRVRTDGISDYRSMPLLVVLPNSVEQVRVLLQRSEAVTLFKFWATKSVRCKGK